MFFKWKKRCKKLDIELLQERALKNVLVISNNELAETLSELSNMFPLRIGETVYTLQLRNAVGKFTSKNPTLEQSAVVPTEVTKRNYFGLVDKFKRGNAFIKEDEALTALTEACTK